MSGEEDIELRVRELVRELLRVYPTFMKFVEMYAPDEIRRWELYRRMLEDEKVPSITKISIGELLAARFESLLAISGEKK